MVLSLYLTNLVEKLKSDLGLELPEFDADIEEEDDKYQLEYYFEKIEDVVAKKPNWQFQRQVSFGFFNYLDIVIFNDLLPENWAATNSLLGHEIIARLLVEFRQVKFLKLMKNETSTV